MERGRGERGRQRQKGENPRRGQEDAETESKEETKTGTHIQRGQDRVGKEN